jgi:hypothetical protein
MAPICLTVAEVFFFLCAFYQRPQRPYWPPLRGLHCPLLAPGLPPLPPRLPPLAPPRGGPPWCPDPRAGPDPRPEPRPLWAGGSWPVSHSGVGGGTGLGGEVGGEVGSCPFAAFFFFAGAGAGTGTTDSSLALLFSGSPSSPPLTRSVISFLAANRMALEVRWTPSPAQMLAPSTVVRS